MKKNHKIPDKPDNPDIESMFDSIAWRYDFLNHLLSFGTDLRWRKKAISLIPDKFKNPKIIDVAAGTGDLAIEAAKLDPDKITAIDISNKMLEIGRRKIAAENLSCVIDFIKCDSMNICFEDNTFDIAMAAFGVRNFKDPVKGLIEMKRVLRCGGFVMILEFSKPEGFIFKHLYNIYFRYLLPAAGAFISKHRRAYKYLNESVMCFADSEKFMDMMIDAGFSDVEQTRLTLGIATIYTGVKK